MSKEKKPAPSGHQQGSEKASAPSVKKEDEDDAMPHLVDDDDGGSSSTKGELPPLVDGPEEDELPPLVDGSEDDEPPPLVDGSEEDEPPPHVDGPEDDELPPLVAAPEDDELPPLVAAPEDDEPPPLVDEPEDDEPPPLLDASASEDEELPNLVDSEEEGSMPSLKTDPAYKDDADDDMPSLRSDPDASEDDVPSLESDEDSDDSDGPHPSKKHRSGKAQEKPPGFRPGFLNKSQRAAQPYAQQGVGHREGVARSKPAKPAPASQPAAAAAPSGRATKKKAETGPEMADISELSHIQQERQKERDALLRQHNLAMRETAAANTCIGRCCLRPGSLGFGDKWCCDKEAFSVRESERRLLMSCSEGCTLLFHYPGCWRSFKDGHHAMLGKEVEDVVLKGKKKMVTFPCLTDSCTGYMRQAVLLEGPRGEVLKHKQYDIPPELEEHLQATRAKEREEKLSRYCKRKPAEDQVAEGAVPVFTKEKKKKARKGEAGAQRTEAAGDKVPNQQQQQEQHEGWTEIGGLSRGLRKEAAREAREADRARDAAAKAAKEQEKAAAAGEAGPSGGIKIARRAQPEPEAAVPEQQEEPGREEEERPAPVPEFLIPDDTLLKPLHKVAEEEEVEAERQRVAAAAHAHKEQRDQEQRAAASERDRAEAQSKQTAEAQQRKKKKATKLNLGSLWQETGGTFNATSPTEAAPSADISRLPAKDKKEAQSRAQAPFSMANFPTLEDAAAAARSGKEREEAQAMDDMLEALRQLKISIDRGSASQHLLIECLDIRPILEQGKTVEEVVMSMCAEAGTEVIQMEVFERQDAVAITAATVEQAEHCMVQLQLQQVHRRKIQLCFLEEFPSHALLNKMVSDLRAADGAESTSSALPAASMRERGPFAASIRVPSRPPPPPRHVQYVSTFPELLSQHRPIAPPHPAAPTRGTHGPAAPPVHYASAFPDLQPQHRLPPPPPPALSRGFAPPAAPSVLSGSPPLNPAARAFAPSLTTSNLGANLAGAATASCSSASSVVGAGEPGGGTSTNAVAARSSTAARLLQQQRQQQQQQQPRLSPPLPPVPSRTAAQAVAPRGATPEDEEDAALQLALEVSKQDTHMRDVWEQQEQEQEQADRLGPVQPTEGAPTPSQPLLQPSITPELNMGSIIQGFNTLHFSITNTQVLGKYRSLSQFQLSASLFKDPEMINSPERCGLALFNIDTQALEGFWEATFCDTAADRVFFQKVLDSPALPLPCVKALLDRGSVPMTPLDSERLSLQSKAKLSGHLASAVVRMMLLGPRDAPPPNEAAALPPATVHPPRPAATPSPPPAAVPPPPRPSPSLTSAARGGAGTPPQPSVAAPSPTASLPARPPGAPSPPPAVAATSSAQPIATASALAAAVAPHGPSPPPLHSAAVAAPPAAPISAAAQQPAQAPAAPPQGQPPRAPTMPAALPPALAMMMSRLPRPQQPAQQPQPPPPQPQPQLQPPLSPIPMRPSPTPASPASPPPTFAPSPPAFSAPSPANSSSATSAAAAQPPTVASRPSPPLPAQQTAAATAPPIHARLMCIMCSRRKASWFNMVCKHMGPCDVCMPEVQESYKQCLKCGGEAKLRRVF